MINIDERLKFTDLLKKQNIKYTRNSLFDTTELKDTGNSLQIFCWLYGEIYCVDKLRIYKVTTT